MHDRGQDRDDDDGDDHQLEVLLNGFQSPEPPPTQQEEQHPGNAARDVVDGEPGVVHLADAGDERREGPDDGHEPGQDDRHAAVPLVKRVRLEQVLRFRSHESSRANTLGPR